MRLARALILSCSILSMVFAMPAGARSTGGSAGSTATNVNAGVLGTSIGGDNIVADQHLAAIVTNLGQDTPAVVQNGVDPRFRTGDGTIRDNAFGSFSGILTQNLNSGVNSVSQAATNVAVSGGFNPAQRL